jgi:alpha-galactosidase
MPILIMASLVFAATTAAPTTGFITRNGSALMDGSDPYRAAGTNAYWLGCDENEGGVAYPTRFRITDALETIAGWLGKGALVRATTLGVSTGGPLSFEPSLGVFNSSALVAADWAVAEAERLGLRLVIPLTDEGRHFAGGKRDFTDWLGLNETVFYTDERALAAFVAFVRERLLHVNPFTGRHAFNEPAIAIWETGNELKATAAWTEAVARAIKSIDTNHLVMDGSYWVELSAEERLSHVAIAEVDVYTDHFYPASATRLAADLAAIEAGGKVFSLGEFGGLKNTDAVDAMLLTCIADPVCAHAAPWSFFPHADDHGFIQHGDGFTFHFPGWNSTASLHLVAAMRNFSNAVHAHSSLPQGAYPGPYPGPTSAPVVTSATPGVVAWRGVAMAGAYDVQLGKNAAVGPWSNVSSSTDRPTDNDTPWAAPSVKQGDWVRVRGVGFEDDSVVGPWSDAVQVGALQPNTALAAAAVAPRVLPPPPPPPLVVLSYGISAGGFRGPPRGWNSWGLVANKKLNQTQDAVLRQCGELPPRQAQGGAQYCSLDSGWSVGAHGDAHGRIIPDTARFPDLVGLSAELGSKSGTSLGVYVIPGTFALDGAKPILGTSGLLLNSTWKHQSVARYSKFCRMEFDFSKPGVQEWHNSVVDLLCETYAVRYIKLDYICPTSSPDGCEGFADSKGAVAAYHTAIRQSKCNGTMRLGLSWMLDWDEQDDWETWAGNADSMRLDEDINNSGKHTLVSFSTVQRAIERYRVFVTSLAQSRVNGGPQNKIKIRPDMDNTFVANNISLSGLHDAQRYTMAMHWIGAGANLYEGGDLTQVDALGRKLLWADPAVHGGAGGIAEQFAEHPMQPRNPHSESCPPHWPFVAGAGNPQQLQAWIAGPNAAGDALVIVSNLGADEDEADEGLTEGRSNKEEEGGGTFRTKCAGSHKLSISFVELGLAAEAQYEMAIVWDGRAGAAAMRVSADSELSGANEHLSGVVTKSTIGEVSVELGPWESVMYKLTRAA